MNQTMPMQANVPGMEKIGMEKIALPPINVGGIDFLVSGAHNRQSGRVEFVARQISQGALTPEIQRRLRAKIRDYAYGYAGCEVNISYTSL